MFLSEIVSSLDLVWEGEDIEISAVNTLENAGADELTFLANAKYLPLLKGTEAGAVIVPEEYADHVSRPIVSSNPYLDFARAVQLFVKPRGDFQGVSSHAFIDESAEIGDNVRIAAGAYIGSGAVVGSGTAIYPGVYIAEDSRVGDNCTLYANVSLMSRTIIGNRVILHAGVVLGSDGFGFAQAETGMEKFPQIGNVVLEDDVEVGANSTVDRGALGETRIGRGCKIDNLVQIGHNVQIGSHTVIVAQVGIAGSTTLGEQVVLAGQVGIAGHINIGDRCRVAAKTGVNRSLDAGKDYGAGVPAMERRAFLRTAATIPKLPEMAKTLRSLQKEIAELKSEMSKEKDNE